MLIDSMLYFRRIDNPADSLSIYRCQALGRDLGEIPALDDETETIFNLNDLVSFYQNYAVYDSRIKEFGEKITERVKLGEHHDLIHSF
jgi:hypothetical protein